MILGDNINGWSREIEKKLSTKQQQQKKKKKENRNLWDVVTFFNHFAHFGDNGTYFELFDSENDVWNDDYCTNKICAHNVSDVFQTGCFEVHDCISSTCE